MSNTLGRSIFHPTSLCPSVAEYQSKVNSSGIPANSLLKDVNINQGSAQAQNFLLSSKFRGNKLYVRKRKSAMGRLGRVAGIPHAVLTTDHASELSEKYKLYGDIELQVGVDSAGSITKVDIQVSYSSDSLILHWGVIRDKQANWALPSCRPNGTTVYKNKALRSPFLKSGSGFILKIEIDDPTAQAIEFLIFDEAKNKWFKNNSGNFLIKLPMKERLPAKGRPVNEISVPEDLVQIQAYLRWERKGKQMYNPEQEKEYEAARKELLDEVARGISVQDLRARLTNKTSSTEEKEPPVSQIKIIPDELVQIQAYVRWEKAGKPNYSADQQSREFEEARKELLAGLEKGTSIDERRKKMTKGEIQRKVAKQLKSKKYFSVERIQRKGRDLMQLINKHVAKDVNLQDIARPKALTLTVLERYAKAREEQVLVTKVADKTKVHLATDFKEPISLHWALSRTTQGQWLVPPPSALPPGSVAVHEAAETQFKTSPSDPSYEVKTLDIEVEDDTFEGMPFVLVSGERWIKNSGSDFYIEFDKPKKLMPKVVSR